MLQKPRQVPKAIGVDGAITLLQILFDHYEHQNDLKWGRTQALLGLQVAGIAGCWAAKESWAGPGAVLLAAIVTFALGLVIVRDDECRDANLRLMQDIEAMLLPGDEWIADVKQNRGKYPVRIRVGTPPSGIAGSDILIGFVIGFIGIDFALAICAAMGSL